MPPRPKRSQGFAGCLKYGLLGCGGLFLFALIASFVGGALIMKPFTDAIEARGQLEERFGEQSEFVPAADGAVPAERMQAFLAVRRQLVDLCAEFASAGEQLRSLEALDGQEEVSRSEVMRAAMRLSKSAMGLPSGMGGFFARRNQALLDADMGLGEFTYIYLTAYHEELLTWGHQDGFLDGPAVNRRILEASRTMLEHQLEASAEASEALRTEIEAMEQDPSRLPWAQGLPFPIEESLAPFRRELDELYCPATASLELRRNTRRGPAIETE